MLGSCILFMAFLWVSVGSPKGSVHPWFVQFCLHATTGTTVLILLGHWLKWDHYKHHLSQHCVCVPCWDDVSHKIISPGISRGSPKVGLSLFYTILSRWSNWDNCTHHTWKQSNWVKWDHYKHPLPKRHAICCDNDFSLEHIYSYQYGPLKYQCIYGSHNFACVEQVRPLNASCLKPGDWVKWDHCKHPL